MTRLIILALALAGAAALLIHSLDTAIRSLA